MVALHREIGKVPTRRLINWNEIGLKVDDIIEAVKDKQYWAIVGIGRGGLIPAVMISQYIDIPLIPIIWQTRDGKYRSIETLRTVAKCLKKAEADGILIVDDINDTGETLHQVKGQLVEFLVEQKVQSDILIETAVLYQRSLSSFDADIIGECFNTQQWLVFPWEKSNK